MTREIDTKLVAVVALVAMLILSSSASAQRGRGYRWLFGTSKAELATLNDVQAELKLSDEQKTRIVEIHDEWRDGRRAMFGTGFGRFSDIFAQSEQLNRDAAKKVDGLLDKTQRKRLQEIAIQQNGPRSLHDPAVVAALSLSDEQQAKLAQVREENGRAFEDAVSKHGREWRQQAGDLIGKSDERLIGVFTDQQRDRLDAMKGVPLEIDMSQLRGRGGR